jgi:hypothetical protein
MGATHFLAKTLPRVSVRPRVRDVDRAGNAVDVAVDDPDMPRQLDARRVATRIELRLVSSK